MWQQVLNLFAWCGGGGEKYSGPLKRLQPGNRFVAYQKGAGYVGYGIVKAAPELGISRIRSRFDKFVVQIDAMSVEATVKLSPPSAFVGAK
jgi:hypothetical protein